MMSCLLFAVELNSSELFIAVVFFQVDLLLHSACYDSAFALTQLLVDYCEEVRHMNGRITGMIKLGKVSEAIGHYNEAITFYQKAVEFTWITGQKGREQVIYDQMGYAYYMNGDLHKASYYHER